MAGFVSIAWSAKSQNICIALTILAFYQSGAFLPSPKAPGCGQEFASMEPKQGRDAFPKCCCGVLARSHFS
jgi:hypothetical protein